MEENIDIVVLHLYPSLLNRPQQTKASSKRVWELAVIHQTVIKKTPQYIPVTSIAPQNGIKEQEITIVQYQLFEQMDHKLKTSVCALLQIKMSSL